MSGLGAEAPVGNVPWIRPPGMCTEGGVRLRKTLVFSGIIVDVEDCREIVERDLENGEFASIRPPPRGGCRPEEDGLWIASAERKERAAGGVLRVAVDACFCMVQQKV